MAAPQPRWRRRAAALRGPASFCLTAAAAWAAWRWAFAGPDSPLQRGAGSTGAPAGGSAAVPIQGASAAARPAATQSGGARLLSAGELGVTVFPSTVDPNRHSLRVAAILDTWGGGLHAAGRLAFIGGNATSRGELRWGLIAGLGPGDRHQGSSELLRVTLSKVASEWPAVKWLLKADDITFVTPLNLADYLATRDAAQPQLLGRRLQLPGRQGDRFCSGGAGYVLSSAAMQRLLPQWCPGDGWLRTQGGDIAMSTCLERLCGAEAIPDTRDGTGERFNVYPPARTYHADVDDWIRKYTPWYAIPKGAACCAPRAATWHYVDWGEARALHSVLTDPASWRAMSDAVRRAAWPAAAQQGMSYYSHRFKENDPAWEILLPAA